MAKHGICHVEWGSTDLERTRRFYTTLFDWKFETWGDGSYNLFEAPGGIGGGFCKMDSVPDGDGTTVYVAVDDIDAYLKRAADLGGGTAMARMEIPGIGWSALMTDPDGNKVGLFQPAPR